MAACASVGSFLLSQSMRADGSNLKSPPIRTEGMCFEAAMLRIVRFDLPSIFATSAAVMSLGSARNAARMWS